MHKGFEPHKLSPGQEKTEIVNQAEVKKSVAFIGQFKLKKGHKIWKLKPDKTIVEVQDNEFEEPVFVMVEKVIGVKKMTQSTVVKNLIEEEGCWYTVALNTKNAEKKFKRVNLI